MKKNKKILSVLLSVLILLSNIVLVNAPVLAAPGRALYTGRYIPHEKGFKTYYARESREGGEEFPAYCWDELAGDPDGNAYYKELEDGVLEPKYQKMTHVVKEGDQYYADAITTKILYNGYQIDAAGIKAAYGISDSDFHAATQKALWAVQNPAPDSEYGYQTSLSIFNNKNQDERVRKIFYVMNLLLKGTPHKKTLKYPTDTPRDTVMAFEDDPYGQNVKLQDPPEDFRVKIFNPGSEKSTYSDGYGQPKPYQRLAIMEFTSKPVVNFVKVDNHDKAVSGAHFELQKDGQTFLNWESDGLPRRLQLEETEDNAPRTYVIKETQVLPGYDKAEDIQFKIRKTQNGRYVISNFEQGVWGPETGIGYTYTVKMVNQKQSGEVNFKKVSLNDGTPLGGAAFEIYAKDRPTVKVANFETQANGESEALTLEKATEYILKEVKVPSAKYKKMADVHFTFNGDGSLSLKGENREDVQIEGNQIILKNAVIDAPYVEVRKIDNFGNPLPGASIEVERVARTEATTRSGYSYTSDGTDVHLAVQMTAFETLELENGKNGLKVVFLMNPGKEDWGGYRPYYFVTVPNGLQVKKIKINDDTYNKDNFSGASRFYSSRANGKYDYDFDRMIRPNDTAPHLETARPLNHTIIINWESGGSATDRFEVLYEIEENHTLEDAHMYKMIAGQYVGGLLNNTWARSEMYTFVLPYYESFESTEHSKVFLLKNIEGETAFNITEESPAAGYTDYKLKRKIFVNKAGEIREAREDEYTDEEKQAGYLEHSPRLIYRNPENLNEFVFINEKDDIKTVKLIKKSSDGSVLENVEFTLSNLIKREIDNGILSEATPKELSLKPGKYYLKENRRAPNHEPLEKEIAFEVRDDGSVVVVENPENAVSVENGDTLVITNEKIEHTVKFNKTGIDAQNLANVVFELKGPQGPKSQTREITTENRIFETTLKVGDYLLSEKNAPAGYKLTQPIKFRVLSNGTLELLEKADQDLVSVSDTASNQLDIVNQLDEKDVQISKVDAQNLGLKGARINILAQKTQKVLASWFTKEGETTKTIKLSPGTYIFNEQSAPEGYDKVADFEFTVTADGQIQTSVPEALARANANTLTVVDQRTMPKIFISKEKVSGERLADASLQILNADGQAATIYDENHAPISEARFVSKVKDAQAIYLAAGNYKLRETHAPQNYVAVSDIDFTVSDTGRVSITNKAENVVARTENNDLVFVVVNSENNTKKVVFSKQNLGGEEIAGAGIEIKQGDQLIAYWVSEANKSHELLLQPGEYTFKETFAPEGYEKITAFNFTVQADGNVVVGQAIEGVTYENGKMVITNKVPERISQDGQAFSFIKQNRQGQNLAGASLQIYKVEAQDQLTLVEQWTSTTEARTVHLADGNYLLREFSAPKGYYLVKDVRFSVNGNTLALLNEAELKAGTASLSENNTCMTVVDDSPEQIFTFSKVKVDGTLLAEAKFDLYEGSLTGRLVHTWTSSATAGESLALPNGTYVLKETQTPGATYETLPVVKFTISDAGITDIKEFGEANEEKPISKVRTGDKDKVYVEGLTLFAVNESIPTYSLTFTKQGIKGTALATLAGATLQIKKDTEIVHTWTSSENQAETIQLPAGEYTFHEETAPIGYDKVADFNFTISETGEVTLADDADAVAVQLNQANKTLSVLDNHLFTLHLKKRDVADFVGKPDSNNMDDYDRDYAILNASFTLEKENKGQWETVGANNNTVNGYLTYANLTYGSYRITENSAPEFYTNIASFEFDIRPTRDLENAKTGIVLDPKNTSEDDAKFRVFFNNNRRSDLVMIVGNELTQNLKPQGEIKTSVTAAGETATRDQALRLASTVLTPEGIEVQDTLTYKGLVPNKFYEVTATLMHIPRDGSVPVAVNGAVVTARKRSSVTGSADAQSPDKWVMNFGKVAGLEVGETYVVYEVAQSVENLVDTTPDDGTEAADGKHILEHKDPTDKAQTFTVRTPSPEQPIDETGDKKVGALRTTVTAEGVAANENAEARIAATEVVDGVRVEDTITYENLAGNQDYKVTTTLMHIPKDGSEPKAVAGVSKEQVLRADAGGNGTWTIVFENVQGLEKDEKYVVYEVAESVDLLVDSTGDKQADKKHTVEHKDPQDKAQTLVVRPDVPEQPIDETGDKKVGALRTTVTAEGVAANENAEARIAATEVADGVRVEDTITYENLAGNQDYKVTTSLMHIPKDGSEPKAVAGASKEQVLRADASGNGTWTIVFEKVQGLEKDEKYVVYEVAESVDLLVDSTGDKQADKKHTVEHKDPQDKAQTLVVRPDAPEEPIDETGDKKVGALRTTVTAEGVAASENTEARIAATEVADGVRVEDTITYENLAGNQDYKVTTTLMHIPKDGSEPKAVAGASKEQVLRVDAGGNGTWTIVFENVQGLEKDEKYVVYEVAESVDLLVDSTGDKQADKKHTVEHKDPQDKAQTLVVRPDAPEEPIDETGDKKVGALRTTVSVGGEQVGLEIVNASVATDKEPASLSAIQGEEGVRVSDTITYTHLAGNQDYKVTTSLMHIPKDGSEPKAVAGASKEQVLRADASGNGTWTVVFEKVQGLEKDEKYVVYEVAESVDLLVDSTGDKQADKKHTVEHKDPEDKAQTLVVRPKTPENPIDATNGIKTGRLRTTVKVEDKTASREQFARVSPNALEEGVRVEDKIDYIQLVPDAIYRVTATLMHIKKDGTLEAVATESSNQRVSATGIGTWMMVFEKVKGLQAGEKYVVYENAESLDNLVDTTGDKQADSKHTVVHKDPTDQAQTFVVESREATDSQEGTLRTSVTAAGKTANAQTEARVNARNLVAGIRVEDKIDYTNLKPNENYEVTATLMHITKDGDIQAVPNATKTESFTTSERGNGTWTIVFDQVQGLQADEKYVVYEEAVSEKLLVDTTGDHQADSKHTVLHKDPTDKAQTFVLAPNNPNDPIDETGHKKVGTLRTTVTAQGQVSSPDEEARLEADSVQDGIQVVDKIEYEQLVPNQYYEVTTTLMHIKKDGTALAVEGVSKKETYQVSATGQGTWTVVFEKVKDLDVGEKYVIYEKAESLDLLVDTDGDQLEDSLHTVLHENPEDLAQTFVVRTLIPEEPIDETKGKKVGTLRTTVIADGVEASPRKPAEISDKNLAKGILVKDQIYYSELAPNQDYRVTATLMHIDQEGIVNPIPVAQVINTYRTSLEGTGTWTVIFENVQGLEAGEKYVVYEEAESRDVQVDTTGDGAADSKHTIIHKDPSDKAQTFVVKSNKDKSQNGTLKTTVKVQDETSSDTLEATVSAEVAKQGVDVVDTLDYNHLKPGETYVVNATLMHVKKDGTISLVANANRTERFIASETGNGTWTMTLPKVQGLQPGEKYVVYEEALSLNLLVDTNADGQADALHRVVHKDPSDFAQTFVVRTETPNESIDETEGKKQGTLKTTVEAGDEKASEHTAANVSAYLLDQGIRVVDTIVYKELAPNQYYRVTTRLMRVQANGAVLPVKGAVLHQNLKASATGQGTWFIDFGKLKGLESGAKYVVYEVAESLDLLVDTTGDKQKDAKHRVVHEDPNDKAQTFVIRPLSPFNPNTQDPGKPKDQVPNTGAKK